jgi:Ciliary BBSome complex subunit 2, C-terminal
MPQNHHKREAGKSRSLLTQLMMWLKNSFYLPGSVNTEISNDSVEPIEIYFKSVKDKSILKIHFDHANNFRLTINYDKMEVVGRILV